MTTFDDVSVQAATDEAAWSSSTTSHEAIVERLQRLFPANPTSRIRAAVDEAASRLADARITLYLPVLIERSARDELVRQETRQ